MPTRKSNTDPPASGVPPHDRESGSESAQAPRHTFQSLEERWFRGPRKTPAENPKDRPPSQKAPRLIV